MSQEISLTVHNVITSDEVNNHSEYSESRLTEPSISNTNSELKSSGSMINLSIGSLANSGVNNSPQSSVPDFSVVNDFPSENDLVEDLSYVNTDLSKKSIDKTHKHKAGKKSHRKHVLPNDVSPFVYDGENVKYNVERGVDYDTPLLIGSRKLYTQDCKNDGSASHLYFDPKIGTLVVGHNQFNIESEKSSRSSDSVRMGSCSLISGIDNIAELDTSFISGYQNSIRLEMIPNSTTEYCYLPPSCSIIGGNQNSITNSSACLGPSSIIASSNVHIQDCENSVFLGMRPTVNNQPFRGWKQATVTQNLYGLNKIHAGPVFTDGHTGDSVLEINGSGYVNGDLNITGNINSGTSTFTSISAGKGVFQHISASSISQQSIYVEGSTGSTGNIDYYIRPNDNVNIVYANPVANNVRLQLGVTGDEFFEPNRVIVVKDSSPEFSMASSNNVYISVPTGVRIEIYGSNGTGGVTGTYGIIASNGGTYVITSSGGAVTLRYMDAVKPDSLPTWVIENQLIGNPRVNPAFGFKFMPATYQARARVLRRPH